MGNSGTIERSPEMAQQQEAILAADILFDRFDVEAQACFLIEARHRQAEVAAQPQEYQDNARTALMEALTASGHLSTVEISGELEEINQQVLNRLLNGWDDFLPEHEKKRRFAEICEELTIQNVHRDIAAGLLPPETAVGIISDCPTLEMPGLGYRYKNQKGMVRSTHLRHNQDGSFTRVIEQVSRSNSGQTTTFRFLSSCGFEMQYDEAADIAALNKPFVYSSRDYIDGIVDIQRRLDNLAGAGIRYGDILADTPEHVDYHELRQESRRREEAIACYTDDLAALEADLAGRTKRGEMSRNDAIENFKDEVDRILSAICMLSPEYAEATFGASSVAMFNQAAELYARGLHEEANRLVTSNNHLKETVNFCGMSISIEDAQRMGLPVNSLGELTEKGKENMKWKQGVCRVEVCPTRPGKTEVGPCSVCRTCQFLFDHGKDPTKFINLRKIFAIKKKVSLTNPKAKEDSTMKAA